MIAAERWRQRESISRIVQFLQSLDHARGRGVGLFDHLLQFLAGLRRVDDQPAFSASAWNWRTADPGAFQTRLGEGSRIGGAPNAKAAPSPRPGRNQGVNSSIRSVDSLRKSA